MNLRALFKIIIFLLLFTYSNFSIAQDPVYYTIGENELNEVDIYSIVEADNGDVYISTDNGIYKYNNGSLLKIPKHENQKGQSLFSLVKTTSGSIFCSNLKGQVFKVKSNHLELFYTIPKEFKTYFPYLLTDTRDNLIVVSSILNVLTNNGVETDVIKNFSFVEKNYNGQIVVGNGSKYFLLHQKEEKYNNPSEFLSRKNFYQKNILLRNFVGKKTKNYNFYIKNKISVNESSNSILTYSPSTYLNILTSYGIQEIIKKDSTFFKGNTFFKDTFISCFTKGQSGTLYLGTFKQGLRIVPNYNFKTIKTASLPRSIMGFDVKNNNEIYLHLRGKGLVHFNKKTQKNTVVEANYVNQRVICKTNFNFENQSNFSDVFIQTSNKNSYYGSVKDIANVNNTDYLAATSMGLIFKGDKSFFKEIQNRKKIDDNAFFLSEIDERCKAVAYNSKTKTIYVATQSKLVVIRKGEISEIKHNNKSIVANSLEFVNDTLLIGTLQQGVLQYKNGITSTLYHLNNGLVSNTIKKIAIKGKYLFVLNSDFFQYINLQTNEIKPFNKEEGVIGYINDFNISDNNLWVLTNNSSIISVPLQQLKSINTKLHFRVDSLNVNNKKVDANEHRIFSYDENNFNFFFHLKNDNYRNQVIIKYKLEGFDKEYNTLTANTKNKEFKKLPYGTYTFNAYAKYGTIKSNKFTYNFTINPPFWKTWWFNLIFILVIFLVALSYFKYSIAQEKKKTQEKLKQQQIQTDLVQAKLTALRSQMNPHFIFNALNSIQNLILKKDAEASYDYVVLFSKLVRNTLNYSEEEFIALEEEIDFLDIYLQLEKLRFGDEFSYSITSNCTEIIEVPSLLVQPFVENALLHGLLNKKGTKNVTVCFSKNNDQLFCTVTDDGIGRKKSAEIQKRQGKKNKSFALTAIQKRLNYLKQEYGETIGYEVIDLFEGDKNTGTKVVIILPFRH